MEAHIPIEPRCVSVQASQNDHTISSHENIATVPKQTITMGIPRNPINTIFSWSNDYLFIGIIIMLITVILVLIVYIVKLRASSTQQTSADAQNVPPSVQRTSADADTLNALANNPFVPLSRREPIQHAPQNSPLQQQQHRPLIEEVPQEREVSETKPETPAAVASETLQQPQQSDAIAPEAPVLIEPTITNLSDVPIVQGPEESQSPASSQSAQPTQLSRRRRATKQ
jgi:hypothetical protein